MPRKASLIPSRNVHVCLPESLMTRLDLILWSDLEGRIPQGAYQRFFMERLLEHFSRLEEGEKP